MGFGILFGVFLLNADIFDSACNAPSADRLMGGGWLHGVDRPLENWSQTNWASLFDFVESRKEVQSICNIFMYFSKITIHVLRHLDPNPNVCAFPGHFGWLFLKKSKYSMLLDSVGQVSWDMRRVSWDPKVRQKIF